MSAKNDHNSKRTTQLQSQRFVTSMIKEKLTYNIDKVFLIIWRGIVITSSTVKRCYKTSSISGFTRPSTQSNSLYVL